MCDDQILVGGTKMRKYNVLEELLHDYGCNVDSINSCLVIAPSNFRPLRSVGNALIEYYNLPHKELFTDDDVYEMQEIIDDILYQISGCEYDIVICVTTSEIDDKYDLECDIHDYVKIKKHEVYWHTDSREVYVADYLNGGFMKLYKK